MIWLDGCDPAAAVVHPIFSSGRRISTGVRPLQCLLRLFFSLQRHSLDARTSSTDLPLPQRCAQLQRHSLHSYLAVVVVVLAATAVSYRLTCHLSHLVLVLLLEAPADEI